MIWEPVAVSCTTCGTFNITYYAAVHAAPRARIVPLRWAAALDRPSAPGGGGGVERLEGLERRVVVVVREGLRILRCVFVLVF